MPFFEEMNKPGLDELLFLDSLPDIFIFQKPERLIMEMQWLVLLLAHSDTASTLKEIIGRGRWYKQVVVQMPKTTISIQHQWDCCFDRCDR